MTPHKHMMRVHLVHRLFHRSYRIIEFKCEACGMPYFVRRRS